MARDIATAVSRILSAAPRSLLRPELLLFLPSICLAAYWFGGESLLLLSALGLPLLMALLGALSGPRAPGEPDSQPVPLRSHLVASLDATLRDAPETGLTTACLVLMFDNSETLLDRHGRAAQSEILQRSTERLCAMLRPTDTVARLEGGGFAVALAAGRRIDLESVIQIASRLQTALAEPVSIDATRIYVSCSVGFCLATRAPAQSGAAMLDAAQVAADEALRCGPGAIRAYAPDMARKRADRDALREQLEIALDHGQIRAYFQPQISADTGAVTGFEALARWQHADRGLISPAEFLSAIEESGLSERLSEVMLFQSLVALSRWDKAGLDIPTVGVNFSAEELRNPRLAEKLRWELDRFDLSPERLSVEILETVVAQTGNDVIVRNIAALAEMGCGIDLDDFGTGHSSITNIRRFRIRRLKIDRSFVSRVDSDRDQQRIVAAILSLAERLGLDTLAEGVESRAEHAMLAQLGCGHLQGFGIGRPMPLEDTFGWIRDHSARIASAPRIGHRTG